MADSSPKDCWFNEKLPPPVSSSYTPKGEWRQIDDLKSCPPKSNKAVILVYDAFGPSSQVLQGADRLAEHLEALVVMPDLFRGQAPHPLTDRAAWQEFRKTLGSIETNVKAVIDFIPALETHFQTVGTWGCFGLCWGGKVAVVAAVAENSLFTATGQTHPGSLSADDARALTSPHICMPSKDEPEDVVLEYERILAEKRLGRVERFPRMFHGWMGARANLTDEENVAEYERGYRTAARFFAEHL